jgi:hypothetical protein
VVRWQLSRITGSLGPISVTDVLAGRELVPDAMGQCRLLSKSVAATGHERLCARVQPLLEPDRPNWVILPHAEHGRRGWWQERLGEDVEIGFGRAAVALALSQLDRLGNPGRITAVNGLNGTDPGIEGVIALEWSPAQEGLRFEMNQVDGRLDARTDVGALLERGRQIVSEPDVVFCPGTGGDGHLEGLLPFLAQLGDWVSQTVRWEFTEAPLGRLGVVGSLYNWAWVEAGYRLGDWKGPAVVLDMDESPLVGLSVVNWAGADGAGPTQHV